MEYDLPEACETFPLFADQGQSTSGQENAMFDLAVATLFYEVVTL